jgi:nucleotide-binding universal stress UspA family protein
VCGTDFTEPAAQAADVAAGLAVALGHPLLLVHAASPGGRRSRAAGDRAAEASASDDLRREANRLRARGAVVAAEVHRGHADEVLTALARQTRAGLIVVGARGSRLPKRRFLGSIAERTAETASVPTLVVRNAASFEPWFDGRRPLRIFVGFDFTLTAEAAAEWVRLLASVRRCEVTAGHVNRPSDDQRRLGLLEQTPASGNSPHLQDVLERQIRDRVRAILGGQDAHVRVQPQWGRPVLALVGMAIDARSDLTVVGTHQRQGLPRLWSGSVSRGVLSEAPMSVAVVPVAILRDRTPAIPKVNRVLVAADFGPSSHRAVAYACGIARPGGVVRVVHVVHPRAVGGGEYETALGESDRHREHARALASRLEALRPTAAEELGLETEAAVVESDDAVTSICQDAERFNADVIVVGTKGAGASQAVLGSVAEGVVAKSRRPVLVVTPVKR